MSVSSPRGHARPRSAQAPDARRDDPRVVARVHRRDRRHRRAPDHRGGSRPRADGAAVDLPFLLARPRVPVPGGRRDRRPLWPAPRLHRRDGGLRRSLAPGRRRAERGRSDRCPHAPGCRGRVPDDELAGAPSRRVRCRCRARDRALDVVHERRDDSRPAGRRRAHRMGVVALDLPPQPASRRRRRLPRTARPRRGGRVEAHGKARPGRRRARRNRLRPPDLRARRGRRSRFRKPLVDLRGSRRGPRRLRRRRDAGRRADAPVRPLPGTELRRCKRADVPRLRGSLRLHRLLHALPAVPRLHAFRGRPPEHPHEHRHDPARRALRRARRPPGAAPVPDGRPGADRTGHARLCPRRHALGVLDLRHRRPPPLLTRPGHDGGSHHRNGPEVGARALRRHRLRRQLDGLTSRKPGGGRGHRPRHHAGLRGPRRRRGSRASGSNQTASELREASVDGFRAGMAVAAALAFAGAAVGAFGISNREARGEKPPVSEQAPAPAGS